MLATLEIVLALLILALVRRVIIAWQQALQEAEALRHSATTNLAKPKDSLTLDRNRSLWVFRDTRIRLLISPEPAPMKEHTMHEHANHIPLARLAVGQHATIVRVGGAHATRRRLMDMGMVTGATVTMKAVAPLGDPVELIIKGYQLSLRKHEASEIVVEVAT